MFIDLWVLMVQLCTNASAVHNTARIQWAKAWANIDHWNKRTEEKTLFFLIQILGITFYQYSVENIIIGNKVSEHLVKLLLIENNIKNTSSKATLEKPSNYSINHCVWCDWAIIGSKAMSVNMVSFKFRIDHYLWAGF